MDIYTRLISRLPKGEINGGRAGRIEKSFLQSTVPVRTYYDIYSIVNGQVKRDHLIERGKVTVSSFWSRTV